MYKYTDHEILLVLETLGREFPHLNWDFHPDPSANSEELVSYWPGDASEEVMVNGSVSRSLFIDKAFFYSFCSSRSLRNV